MDTTDKTSRSSVEAGPPFLHMCGLELDVEGRVECAKVQEREENIVNE